MPRPARQPRKATASTVSSPQKGEVAFSLPREVIEYETPPAVSAFQSFTPENPGPTNRQAQWVPKFLETLALVGTIGTACAEARISRSTYNKFAEQNADFREAVRIAKLDADDRLELALWMRAHEGVTQEKGIWGTKRVKGADGKVEVVPFQYGTEVKREYSDTLGMFLLKARNPDKYSDRQRIISETAPSLKDVLIEMARQRGVDPQAALEQANKFLENLRQRKEMGLA